MNRLRDLQQTFSDNLFDPEAQDVFLSIGPGSFEPAQRMQIYRNNVFIGLTEALRAVYPVIEKLVGEGFFLYACNEYIHRFPSTSGDLHEYGSSFDSFLRSFEPAQTLPYLHGVATLEWSYHEVYHEADSEGLNLERLSAVAANQYCALCFSLNPACRLTQSRFPIVEIWRVNQDDYEGDQAVDLDSGGGQCPDSPKRGRS